MSSIYVMKTLNFQRVAFPQMKELVGLVRNKLKKKVKKVQALLSAWKLFKMTILQLA